MRDNRMILLIELESLIIRLGPCIFIRFTTWLCRSQEAVENKVTIPHFQPVPVETGSRKWSQKFRLKKLTGGQGGQTELIFIVIP